MGCMGVMTARMPYAGMRVAYAALLHLVGDAALYVRASKVKWTPQWQHWVTGVWVKVCSYFVDGVSAF